MSRVFLGQANTPETGNPYPDDWAVDMGDQFTSAERIASNRGITRADVDSLGLRSQQRAAQAWAESRFDGQIAPVEAPEVLDRQLTGNTVTVTRDQGLRETTPEGLGILDQLAKLDWLEAHFSGLRSGQTRPRARWR